MEKNYTTDGKVQHLSTEQDVNEKILKLLVNLTITEKNGTWLTILS